MQFGAKKNLIARPRIEENGMGIFLRRNVRHYLSTPLDGAHYLFPRAPLNWLARKTLLLKLKGVFSYQEYAGICFFIALFLLLNLH